jgi:hypothetical protein
MPVNQYLTDRNFVASSALTMTSQVHIVVTGDTSQNPAGSSYKSNLEQINNLFESMPSLLYYKTTSITGATENINYNYNYYGVTFSGNCGITLPNPTGKDGFTFKIKDERGTSVTYPITITPSFGLIDGSGSVIMNINYMSLSFVARNNNWWLI